MAASSAALHRDDVGGNSHLAIAFNRVEGIGEEVQEELLKHLGIGPKLDRLREGTDDNPFVRHGGLPLDLWYLVVVALFMLLYYRLPGLLATIDGRIDVQSTPGIGSTFTVTVPFARLEDLDTAQPRNAANA